MKTTDFLTELSTDKLAQYKTAAAADASKADKEGDFKRGDKRFSGIVKATKKQFANDTKQGVAEGWSQKYKSSINCSHPKGFSQKAHCAGKKKHNESIEMEMTCPDCGMCETHINQENLDEACWKGYHKEGNKKMFGKTYPNCVKNEGVTEGKWDPFTGGDYGQTPRPQRVGQDSQDNDIAAPDKEKDQAEWEAMLDYYGTNALVQRALGDLYKQTHGRGYHDSVVTPDRYLATIEKTFAGKTTTEKKYFSNKQAAHKYAKGSFGHVVSFEKIDDTEDTTDLITLPVMLGLGQQKKKWMLQFPDEGYAQKWAFKHKNVATIMWPAGHNLEKGVAEGLNEGVGGNYLYHATSAEGLKGMLSSGSIRSATSPQAATSAQTKLPTVSVTRDWGYASGSNASNQMAGIGRDAILVLDRNAVESNFKTLGTSQSTNIKGLAFNPYLKKDGEARSQNTDAMARNIAKGKAKYAEPTAKAGGEFEEAVVVPKGSLPLKGTMVGFWINPKSKLMQDPAIMNDPRRLDMPRPNQFGKAAQQQGVTEDQHSCPHCGGEMVSEELMNEKKDACYYKVKSRYSVWPSAYASGALVKCRNKGASNWGNSSKNESSILEGIESVDESLHDWFSKEKWVRMDTKGNIKGPCAREPGEGKPKCLPQSKAHSLGKKGRASAAARKRREDPNPDRSGKAINVNTKKKD